MIDTLKERHQEIDDIQLAINQVSDLLKMAHDYPIFNDDPLEALVSVLGVAYTRLDQLSENANKIAFCLARLYEGKGDTK